MGGAEILEMKLVQDLASVDQDHLFLVFLYLCKACNTVDRGRLLTTLELYSNIPHIFRLLIMLWYQQEVFTLQNGYHGPHFRATSRNTQGGLMSPTLFNFIVKNAARN